MDYLSSFLFPQKNDTVAPPKSHSPSVKDVHRVKAIFRAKLPLEIIEEVIDFAEYWPHVTGKIEKRIVVAGSSRKENVECLRTPPLCHDTSKSKATSPPPLLPYRSLHPCRKIVFSILSKDQGWGGSSQHYGTYEQSYTWFDVAREPWSAPNSEPPKPKHPFLHGPKTLQKNKLVSKELVRHEIIWNYLDNVDPDSETAQNLATELGRGRATMNGELVREMEVGDSIALWARARFPGWKNNVHDAEVKVFWAV